MARKTRKPEPLLIWGLHPVVDLLERDPSRLMEIRLKEPGSSPRLRALLTLAETHGVPVVVSGKQKPASGEEVHQGVWAKVRPLPESTSIRELLGSFSSPPRLLLALDEIQDPHNFGALVRTAAACGAGAVITTRDRSAPVSGASVKASAGTLARMPLCRVANLARGLQELKAQGYWIYGASPDGATSVFHCDPAWPACLVVGGEHKGLRELTTRQCDELLAIPQASEVESLNVSVAAGILLFTLAHKGGLL